MNKIIIAGCFLVGTMACTKKDTIPPVTGTIAGKPAVSLYGTSNKPTDYMLIDTVTADRKISYDGIVFTYIYNSANTIFIMNPTTPAAKASLTYTNSGMTLTIIANYTITFGSADYASR